MSDTYTTKQNAIYAGLRDAAATRGELHASACAQQPTAGYIIAFRHPETINDESTT